MKAPFSCTVRIEVQCSFCDARESGYGGFISYWNRGSEFMMPSLPPGWETFGDFHIVCPKHKIQIVDKGEVILYPLDGKKQDSPFVSSLLQQQLQGRDQSLSGLMGVWGRK